MGQINAGFEVKGNFAAEEQSALGKFFELSKPQEQIFLFESGGIKRKVKIVAFLPDNGVKFQVIIEEPNLLKRLWNWISNYKEFIEVRL